jgi:hypothetical protein
MAEQLTIDRKAAGLAVAALCTIQWTRMASATQPTNRYFCGGTGLSLFGGG